MIVTLGWMSGAVVGAVGGVSRGLAVLVGTSTALVAALGAAAVWRMHASSLRTVRREAARLRAHVDDIRAKQSRHEYVQEVTLTRIEAQLSQIRAEVEAAGAARRARPAAAVDFMGSHGPRVLMVTSNGAGLGHVARCLAVARAGSSLMRTAILTMSSAHAAVRAAGYPVLHYPSQSATGKSPMAWNRDFADYLYGLVRSNKPDAVVFDGTWIYRGLTEACRDAGIPLIWLRRGAWKPEASRTQLESLRSHCDLSIVPGDVLDEEPSGPGEVGVGPITLASPDSLAPSEAKRALGLQEDARYALVQLGAGNINDTSVMLRTAVEALSRHGDGIIPVVVRSVLSTSRVDIPPSVHLVSGVFPLAPYLAAFEFAVVAAGYNSVVENITARLPSIFVPNEQTVTDDQVARATRAAGLGLGLVADETEIDSAVAELCREGRREELRAALRSRAVPEGAREAAELIVRACEKQTIDSSDTATRRSSGRQVEEQG